MDVINAEKAARLMGGDKELYRELMTIVENTLDEKYERIETALATKNGDDLELFAHQFKGALRNVAAEQCCELLERLEKCGSVRDFTTARTLYEDVKPAVERLLAVYRDGAWEAGFVE